MSRFTNILAVISMGKLGALRGLRTEGAAALVRKALSSLNCYHCLLSCIY